MNTIATALTPGAVPTTGATLSCRDLHKSFGQTPALRAGQ